MKKNSMKILNFNQFNEKLKAQSIDLSDLNSVKVDEFKSNNEKEIGEYMKGKEFNFNSTNDIVKFMDECPCINYVKEDAKAPYTEKYFYMPFDSGVTIMLTLVNGYEFLLDIFKDEIKHIDNVEQEGLTTILTENSTTEVDRVKDWEIYFMPSKRIKMRIDWLKKQLKKAKKIKYNDCEVERKERRIAYLTEIYNKCKRG